MWRLECGHRINYLKLYAVLNGTEQELRSEKMESVWCTTGKTSTWPSALAACGGTTESYVTWVSAWAHVYDKQKRRDLVFAQGAHSRSCEATHTRIWRKGRQAAEQQVPGIREETAHLREADVKESEGTERLILLLLLLAAVPPSQWRALRSICWWWTLDLESIGRLASYSGGDQASWQDGDERGGEFHVVVLTIQTDRVFSCFPHGRLYFRFNAESLEEEAWGWWSLKVFQLFPFMIRIQISSSSLCWCDKLVCLAFRYQRVLLLALRSRKYCRCWGKGHKILIH